MPSASIRTSNGHELLLRPIVDVAFEATPLLVLGEYQAVPRRLEVGQELHVAEDQAGLGGHVGDQPSRVGGERLGG